jgi:hypothetical protein
MGEVHHHHLPIRKLRYPITILFLAGTGLSLLSSCTALTGTRLPTPMPSEYIPTAIALTVEARGIHVATPQPGGDGTAPTEGSTPPAGGPTALPEPTSLTATPTPALRARAQNETDVKTTPRATATTRAITPTPTGGIPFGTIQILSPGPASRVTSPFTLRAYFVTGPKGAVRVELLGEDGRLLMRTVKVYGAQPGAQVNAAFDITYEISAAAEAARAQIIIEDDVGRTMAQESVDLILLSMGEADINPPGDLHEAILIEQPTPNALIQGGTLRVSGQARPRSSLPYMVELQTKDGKIVGSRQVAVIPSVDGDFGTFAVDVPYTVSAPTRVRLSVWERGEHIPGIVHLSSLEVMLSP